MNTTAHPAGRASRPAMRSPRRDAPESGAWPRGRALSIFDRIFLLVILWPYELLPRLMESSTTVAGIPYPVFAQILTICAMMAGAFVSLWHGMQRSRAHLGLYWMFSAIVLLRVATSINAGTNWPVFLSQSNHLIQLILLYPGFAYLVLHARWKDLLRSRKVRASLIILVGISASVAAVQDGVVELHDLNMNIFALALSLLVDRKKLHPGSLLMLALFLLYGAIFFHRITNIAFFALLALLYFADLRSILVKVLSAGMIVAPVVLYLWADKNVMGFFLDLDSNTWIRAEFLRAALPSLADNPIFGIGFDVPYRDIRHDALVYHPLLRDAHQANLVSNHHSIFDTALRLGLPAALLLYLMVFVRPALPAGDRARKLMMLALGLGLGGNAWLENQGQVMEVALLMAFLNFGGPVTRIPARAFRKGTRPARPASTGVPATPARSSCRWPE